MFLLSERHRYFAVIPLFAAFTWFSTLLAMLLTWLITGRPKYVPSQPAIAYISDIGASYLKPLFVVACCITGTGLFLSLTIQRVLRRRGRLPPELYRLERLLGQLATAGGFIAMLGLVLLSVFDTGRFPHEHFIFLLIFMVGVGLSIVFTVIEFGWLAHNFAEMAKLRRAYLAKAVIGLTLIPLSVVFGIAFFDSQSVAGVIEWVIGFGFTIYLLSLAYDLGMARVTKGDEGEASTESMVQIPRGLV